MGAEEDLGDGEDFGDREELGDESDLGDAGEGVTGVGQVQVIETVFMPNSFDIRSSMMLISYGGTGAWVDIVRFMVVFAWLTDTEQTRAPV